MFLKNKLFFGLALVLITILSLFVAPSIYAHSAEPLPEKIQYSFLVKSENDVCTISGAVNFPQDSLKYIGVKLYDSENSVYTVKNGKLYFNCISPNNYCFDDETILITVDFKVLKDFDENSIYTELSDFYTTEQSYTNENEPFYYYNAIDGKVISAGYVEIDNDEQSYISPYIPDIYVPEVEITEERLPGDVNSDGKVNMKDIVVLQQFINKWDVDINESNADVTGDEKVNMKDIVLLQQYINKWEVVLK